MLTTPVTTVRTNAMLALIGNAVYSACQFGVLVAITRLGTTHDVGLFALALAVTAPVLMLANLQLRSLLASDASEESHFSHYLSLRLGTTVLALIGLGLFALLCHPDAGEFSTIIALTAAKSVEAISDIGYGLLQRHELLGRITRSTMVKGVVGLAAFAATFALTTDVAAATWAMTGAWTLILLLIDLPVLIRLLGARALCPSWSRLDMKRLLHRAVPMGVVAGMLSLASVVPGYLLERWHGSEALGRFSPLVYLLAVGNLVVMSAGGAALPRLANYHATGNRHGFISLGVKLMGLTLALTIAILAVVAGAGSGILTLVYGPTYADEASAFLVLTLAAGLGWVASACGYCLTAARVLLPQLPLSSAAAVAGIIAGWWLIPDRGMVGAVWASVIVGSVLAAGYAVGSLLVIRRMEVPPPTGSGP